MAYKDPDKQREADRERQRRYRRDKQGVTSRSKTGVTNARRDKGVTQGITEPEQDSIRTTELREFEAVAGPSVAEPRTDGTKQPTPDKNILKEYKEMHPGLPSSVPSLKRGKDIKCFKDLPPHVQRTIESLTTKPDGSIDQSERANRTAIAINYQHLFPDNYHSTGVAI